MSAQLSEMTNFEIWNAARGIATDSLSAVKSSMRGINLNGENTISDVSTESHRIALFWMSVDLDSLKKSYNKFETEEDLWPYQSFEDFLVCVDDIGVNRFNDDYPDMHYEFSKLVSDRLHKIKRGEFDPSTGAVLESISGYFDQEGLVIETAVGNETDEQADDDVEIAYSETGVVESDSLGSDCSSTHTELGEDSVSATMEGDTTDVSNSDESSTEAAVSDHSTSAHQDTANENTATSDDSQVDNDKSGHTTENEVANRTDGVEKNSVEIDNPDVESVSLDLYRCFISRDGTISYSDLGSKYDHDFPPRSILLTEVINASGDTKSERIENIADWVSEWLGNPAAVQELEKYGYRPMGSRVGI